MANCSLILSVDVCYKNANSRASCSAVLHHIELKNKPLRGGTHCLMGGINKQTNNYIAGEPEVESTLGEEHRGGDIEAKAGRVNRNLLAQQEHGTEHAKQEVTAPPKKGRLQSKVRPCMKVLEHPAKEFGL